MLEGNKFRLKLLAYSAMIASIGVGTYYSVPYALTHFSTELKQTQANANNAIADLQGWATKTIAEKDRVIESLKEDSSNDGKTILELKKTISGLNTKLEEKPKVIYKDKIVYKDKVVYQDKIVYKDRPNLQWFVSGKDSISTFQNDMYITLYPRTARFSIDGHRVSSNNHLEMNFYVTGRYATQDNFSATVRPDTIVYSYGIYKLFKEHDYAIINGNKISLKGVRQAVDLL